MIIFPTCKINLGLQVLRKRGDGFHDLETVMIEIPICDEITIEIAEHDSFQVVGIPIPGDDNLVSRAIRLLREEHHFPFLKVILNKQIPMGAGMGGGSSDASFTLKTIVDHFDLPVSVKRQEELVSQLGSDCAFFIQGGTQFCTGRGEIMEPIALDLTGRWCCVVNNGTHISTAFAYGNITPNDQRESLKDLLQQPLENWQNHIVNDFEAPVFNSHPSIAALKASLMEAGAQYAAMTGSGSTVFGLFDAPKEIDFGQELDFYKWVQL